MTKLQIWPTDRNCVCSTTLVMIHCTQTLQFYTVSFELYNVNCESICLKLKICLLNMPFQCSTMKCYYLSFIVCEFYMLIHWLNYFFVFFFYIHVLHVLAPYNILRIIICCKLVNRFSEVAAHEKVLAYVWQSSCIRMTRIMLLH